MFVRIATARILPGKGDELADFMVNTICKNYEGLPGITGTKAMIDKENSKAVIFIFGESETACAQRPSHGAKADELREVLDISTYQLLGDTC